jgi:hypothetical protein
MSTPYTVLHVGFQKAAAAQIQQALRHSDKKLEKRGVHYVHLRDLRKKLGSQITQAETSAVAKFFSNVRRRDPKRLILSDENLLGPFNHCVRTGRLYQHQSPFISQFASEVPFPIREVHIAIQNYADFFAAAYVQYIRALKPHNTNFITSRTTCLRVFDHLFGWPDVIDTLTTYFPDAQIFIWRHEDFKAHPDLAAGVLNNLVGEVMEPDPFRIKAVSSNRGTFSGQAMAVLEQLALTHGVGALVSARKEIRSNYPTGVDRPEFDPFLTWEKSHLDNLLQSGVDLLRCHQMVTLLDASVTPTHNGNDLR